MLRVCRFHKQWSTEPRGFSIVELLVVLAIIGLLLALSVPAVQSARESARRAECLNNLHQFGQGLAGYESSRGRFPPTKNYSPHAYMLNWLGSPDVYSQITFNNPVVPESTLYDWLPPDWTKSLIPGFRCPSDRAFRGCNYMACVGSGTSIGSLDRRHSGAFSSEVGVSAAEITDGLSNTAAFSEILVSDVDESTADRTRDAWYSGTSLNAPDALDEYCHSQILPDIATNRHIGWYWYSFGFGYSNYNHVRPPQSPRVHCFTRQYYPEYDLLPETIGIVGARSAHPGGVQLLLMDGSARMVSSQVDLGLWRAVSTKANMEPDVGF